MCGGLKKRQTALRIKDLSNGLQSPYTILKDFFKKTIDHFIKNLNET